VFSAIAIATLALGIGGITAMFSAVDAVLIHPLPYADADRLVMIWDDLHKSGDLAKQFPTPAEWLEWRRHNTVFTDSRGNCMGIATCSPAHNLSGVANYCLAFRADQSDQSSCAKQAQKRIRESK